MERLLRCFAVTIVASGAIFAPAAKADVKLQGAGATFPGPIYQAWVQEYQKQHPDIKIDYQAIGSGGGIKGITDKTFDFAGSDAALNRKQVAALGGPDKIIEIPSVAGAIVLAYNIPGFQGDLKLDGSVIADIYMARIDNWNDSKIAELNPGVQLPDLPITAAHRSDGAGTNFVFTHYLCTQDEEFKNKVSYGTQVDWPGEGPGGNGNAGVTQIVQQTKGAIGYVELAYAVQNNIPFAQVKNKDGNFVKATTESVALAGEAAAKDLKGTVLAVGLWNQPGKDVYPIAAFTYLIAYKNLNNIKTKEQAAALKDFLKWAVTDGQKMAGPLNYAPLDKSVQEKDAAAIDELTYKGEALK